MDLKGKSVFVTVCSRNTAYWNMFTAFQRAAGALGEKHGMRCLLHPHVGDSLISRARCLMLQRFMESDCDYLFTLDDDIELKDDSMVKLIEADKDIIGGMYRLKRQEVRRNPYAIRFLDDVDLEINFDDVVEVKYISTGCIMHKRSFIEDLISKYDELYFLENMTGKKVPALYMPFIYYQEYLSEDWSFCQRALDVGYKMYMHAGVQCVHWGLHPFRIEDLSEKDREIKYGFDDDEEET